VDGPALSCAQDTLKNGVGNSSVVIILISSTRNIRIPDEAWSKEKRPIENICDADEHKHRGNNDKKIPLI
jgi:hypothetical protein